MGLQSQGAMVKRNFQTPTDAASVTDESEEVWQGQSYYGEVVCKSPSRSIGKLLNVPAVLWEEASSYLHIRKILVAVGLVVVVGGICGSLLL